MAEAVTGQLVVGQENRVRQTLAVAVAVLREKVVQVGTVVVVLLS